MNSAQRHLELETVQQLTRRHFLRQCATGLGAMWLGGLSLNASPASPRRDLTKPLGVLPPHFAPKAKRVIYLHMAGAPSQLELFQYKPELAKLDGEDCPQEFLEGQRFAFITGVPKLMGPVFPFHRETRTGLWVSDRLPHLETAMRNHGVTLTDVIEHRTTVPELQLSKAVIRAESYREPTVRAIRKRQGAVVAMTHPAWAGIRRQEAASFR